MECRLAGICKHYEPGCNPAQKGVFDAQAILAELLLSKEASGRRPIYTKSLKHYLTRYIKSQPDIRQTRAKDIEAFISQFHGNTRATWLSRINTLFSFAVRREYITKNPCAVIERAKIDRSPPAILTPQQAAKVIALAPTQCRPCVVLCLYAGIRPEECHHLDWSDINLETKTVQVSHTKTRVPRIVPLEQIAVKLLSEHPVKKGKLSPSMSTIRRFKRRVRGAIGFWKSDLLRHTAASYLMALHKDAGKVSTMFGNSSSVMLKHYHTPVSDADSAVFWAVG